MSRIVPTPELITRHANLFEIRPYRLGTESYLADLEMALSWRKEDRLAQSYLLVVAGYRAKTEEVTRYHGECSWCYQEVGLDHQCEEVTQ